MLGISSSYFSCLGCLIFESVKRAVDLGFRHVEMGANHDWEEDIWEELKKIRREFRGISFSIHGYFPPAFKRPYMFNLAEGLTDKNKKVIEGLFRAADILEADLISLHPGINNHFLFEGKLSDFPGFKKFKNVGKIDKKKAKENVYESFDFLVKKGKKRGIKVAVENIYIAEEMGDLEITLSEFADFKAILEAIPGLFFLYDYGHSYIKEEDPDIFFQFRDKIIEMHLSDVKKGKDHRAFGKGEIDLVALLGKIKRLGKELLLVLEHSGEVKKEELRRERELIENSLKAEDVLK